MEATCILKAFVASAKQYFSCEIEPNFLNLQRHLEIVAALASSTASHEVFEPNDLIAAECLTCFIDIIVHHSHKQALIEKVLPVLQNLAKNEIILKALQSTFHLHAALALFLQQHDLLMNDPWVLQCLQLLESVTQDIRISCIEHHLEYLINSLLDEVENKSSEVFVPALHILSNLCRRNPEVQAYICSLPNIKQIVKMFASKLCCPKEIAVIYSLSLLANLMMNSRFGEKVFTHKRAKKGLELIAILLTSSNESSSIAALNLFLDLAQIPQCLQFFIKYDKLDLVFKKIVESYNSETSPAQAARYLKFLWVFTNIPECKEKIQSVLYIKESNSENEEECYNFHPLLWDHCTQTFESPAGGPLHVIRIIGKLFDSFSDEEFNNGEEEMKLFLKKLINNISVPHEMRSHVANVLHTTQVELFDLLFNLCQHKSLEIAISEDLDLHKLKNIVSHEIEWNILDGDIVSESGVDLLLASISLIAIISTSDASAKAFLDEFLQDPRLVSFVASSLSSTSEKRINRGLYMISSVKADFPLLMLSESISIANCKRQSVSSGNTSTDTESSPTILSGISRFRSQSYQSCSSPDKRVHSWHQINSSSRSRSQHKDVDANIDSLLKKFKNGLKLQELKSSEIIELYEHEIATLTMKEKELENLIHSKSAALYQADRVLIQYKCCQAQKEVETLKLRQLLKESERQGETANEKCVQALDKCASLQKELKSVQQDLAVARRQTDEKMERIADLNERINQITAEHEKEQKNFAKVLKEKETEIKDLSKRIHLLDDQLRRSAENYQALEDSKSALKKELEEAGKILEKHQQEMELLEMVCQQHEANLKERDSRIKNLSEELEKHKMITGMIHQISSGKANVSSLLNK